MLYVKTALFMFMCQNCEIGKKLSCGGNKLPWKLERVVDENDDGDYSYNKHFCIFSNRNHHSENPTKDRDKGTDGR